MNFTKGLAAASMALIAYCAPAFATEWKTVRIGMDATNPPFESVDSSGKIVGFEVDYANALCDRMKVTCTFQNQDWDGIIPALLASKFDAIISSMAITPPRAQRVLFSDMYLAITPLMVTGAGNKSEDVSPEALAGKTIGTQSSTTHANYLERAYGKSNIKLYPTQNEANMDLASGRLDYVAGDGLVILNFMDKRANGCCRVVSKIKRLPDVHGPGAGVAVRPADRDLKDMFNKAIAELDADGTYDKLQAKYFKESIRGK